MIPLTAHFTNNAKVTYIRSVLNNVHVQSLRKPHTQCKGPKRIQGKVTKLRCRPGKTALTMELGQPTTSDWVSRA
jgi:hypothetical protein